LKQMQTSIKEFDSAIAETSHRHPCWAIAQSLPGAGPVMGPRLLAAMGNGKRYQNANEMQCASGIAPVTVASGRTRIIQFRTTNQNTSPVLRRGTRLSVGGFPNEDVHKMWKPFSPL